jgi:hypothetical protein
LRPVREWLARRADTWPGTASRGLPAAGFRLTEPCSPRLFRHPADLAVDEEAEQAEERLGVLVAERHRAAAEEVLDDGVAALLAEVAQRDPGPLRSWIRFGVPHYIAPDDDPPFRVVAASVACRSISSRAMASASRRAVSLAPADPQYGRLPGARPGPASRR